MAENHKAEQKTVKFRIKRTPAPGKESFWEEFDVPHTPGMNVISALMAIQKDPTNARGEKTTPPVWECNCLEEVCGACTMVINGKVRQSCAALVDHLEQPVALEPMRAFPAVRDLIVDRSRMFEALKQVHAWIDIDGTYDLGPGPKYGPEEQEWRYELSKCMTCGCCLDVCPNYGPQSDFVGAFAVGQVALMNSHPSGALHAGERLEAIMGPGGITDCGNAQNCVKACPKGIPLTTAIGEIGRDATVHAVKRFFTGS